jgi:hypothetical protein
MPAAGNAATLEVAHEALLRRWPTLADLLREDRDALLLLETETALARVSHGKAAESQRLFRQRQETGIAQD